MVNNLSAKILDPAVSMKIFQRESSTDHWKCTKTEVALYLYDIIALPAVISPLRLMNFGGPGDATKPSSPGWVRQLSPIGGQQLN